MAVPPQPPLDETIDLTTPPSEPLDTPNPITSLSSLLDSNPSIPSFLNSLLPNLPTPPATTKQPTPPGLSTLEKSLTTLLTQLSLLSQDTSSALEGTIHDISRNVPRLGYDLQFMRESAGSLAGSLDIVQARAGRGRRKVGSVGGRGGLELDSDGDETKKALDKLTKLDAQKLKMETTRDILREAESWSTLESEILNHLNPNGENRNLVKAGERLHEAARSLVVFQNSPGEYEERKGLLVSLENQLEGALGDEMVECVGRGDWEGWGRVWGVGELVGREGEVGEVYFRERRKGLLDGWKDAVLIENVGGGVDGAVGFSTFLPKWYGSLLSILQAERISIPIIFPPHLAAQTVSTFLYTTINALTPSLQARLSDVGSLGLGELIRAYRATEELAVGVQAVLDKMAFNAQGGVLSGNGAVVGSPLGLEGKGSGSGNGNGSSPNGGSGSMDGRKPHIRSRMSTSTSFSLRRTPSRPIPLQATPIPSEWETALYEPFLDLQTAYPSLERRYLTQKLSDPSLLATGRGEISRIILDRTSSALGIAEEALNRCKAFTHGYGLVGCVAAIDGFLSTFVFDQIPLLERERDKYKNREEEEGGGDELDFGGLDYSTRDWSLFQTSLHVLGSCRDVGERFKGFQGRLVGIIKEMVESGVKVDPTSLGFGIEGTTPGAIALLQQSPLNSTDLHNLMTTLSGVNTTYTLASTQSALIDLTRSTQVFLQRIILSPLFSQLEIYPTLPVWSQPDKPARRGELAVPTFSLSPTDTIARVSEGLLNLLRVFEVYAADDALAFGIETLPFIDASTIPSSNPPTEPGISPRQSRFDMSLGEDAVPPGITAEIVLTTWISSLTLTLLSHLTKTTLPSIKALSAGGAEQLASDLGYLGNAVRALDVEWGELEVWGKVVASVGSEGEWKDGVGKSEAGEKDVWRLIGKMRGWA